MIYCLYREREYEEEFSHFLEGRDALLGKKSTTVEGLSPEQVHSKSPSLILFPRLAFPKLQNKYMFIRLFSNYILLRRKPTDFVRFTIKSIFQKAILPYPRPIMLHSSGGNPRAWGGGTSRNTDMNSSYRGVPFTLVVVV